MKAWHDALEKIAACNGGEGYAPKLAQEALVQCRESAQAPPLASLSVIYADIARAERQLKLAKQTLAGLIERATPSSSTGDDK